MPVLAVRRFPDPLLSRPAHAVKCVDDSVRQLIERMIATMRHHPHCVGLAAPQVGSALSVAVMDAGRNPRLKTASGLLVLVNPLLDHAEGRVIQREGCLSIPDFTGNVQRALKVRLKALDENGRPYECELEGFEAVVAQHEVDHLNGRLFLDRAASAADIFRRKTYL